MIGRTADVHRLVGEQEVEFAVLLVPRLCFLHLKQEVDLVVRQSGGNFFGRHFAHAVPRRNAPYRL